MYTVHGSMYVWGSLYKKKVFVTSLNIILKEKCYIIMILVIRYIRVLYVVYKKKKFCLIKLGNRNEL